MSVVWRMGDNSDYSFLESGQSVGWVRRGPYEISILKVGINYACTNLGMKLISIRARLSQFFLVGQNTRQEWSGMTSRTNGTKWSGSRWARDLSWTYNDIKESRETWVFSLHTDSIGTTSCTWMNEVCFIKERILLGLFRRFLFRYKNNRTYRISKEQTFMLFWKQNSWRDKT